MNLLIEFFLSCQGVNELNILYGLGCDANTGIGQNEYLSKGDVGQSLGNTACVHICGLGSPKVQRTPKESK